MASSHPGRPTAPASQTTACLMSHGPHILPLCRSLWEAGAILPPEKPKLVSVCVTEQAQWL